MTTDNQHPSERTDIEHPSERTEVEHPSERTEVEHRPEGAELVVFLAGLIAFGAVGIDLILPSFGALRTSFDLAPNSNRVALTVTAFLLGMATGPIPFGAVADRWGRRRALQVSMAIFMLGAAVSPFTSSFPVLLATRFVAGVGAAGTRVMALAILRDRFRGDELGRMLSSVMSVFLLMPVALTVVGAVVIRWAAWQTVFAIGAGLGLVMVVWSIRLTETLDPHRDRPNLLAIVPVAAKQMVRRPEVVAPLIAMTALQTTLSTYLGSTEIIVNDIYGRPGQFPVVFAVISLVMSLFAFLSSRLVGWRGLRGFLRPASLVHLSATTALLLVTLVATDRQPPYGLFLALFGLGMAAHMLLIPNLNSLILEPLPDIAGTVAAIATTFLVALGAILGAIVDAQMGDRVTPVALAMAAVGVVQAVLIRAALGAGTEAEMTKEDPNQSGDHRAGRVAKGPSTDEA